MAGPPYFTEGSLGNPTCPSILLFRCIQSHNPEGEVDFRGYNAHSLQLGVVPDERSLDISHCIDDGGVLGELNR
eukprot:scaffold160_cov333-Pavlova_lutheri.AAC.7